MKNTTILLCFFLISLLGNGLCIAQKKTTFKDDKRVVDSLLQIMPKFESFNTEAEGLHAISLASKIDYHFGEAQSLIKLGLFYRNIHEEEKALENIKKAKEIIDEHGSKADQMDVLYSFVEVYRFFNYHKEALDYGSLTMNLANKLKDSLMIGKILWSTANVHLKIDQRDKYFELGEQALTIFKRLNNVEEMITVYTRFGGITQNIDKKFWYFEKAKELLERIQTSKVFKAKKYLLYSNIVYAYIGVDDYAPAENPIKISLQLAKEIGDNEGEAIMYYYLAHIQFNHHQNYQKAAEYAKKHLEYEKSIGRYYYVIPTAQFLMEIYTAANQPKKALEYADVAMLYQDSLYWANRKDDAKDLDKAYELEKKYVEVQRLEIQRRIRTMIGIGGTLFFLLLAGFFYWQRQLKNRHIKIQEQLTRQLQQDKKTIEQQNEQLVDINATKDRLFAIIGHDLRGPLYSLQGLDDQINYLTETGQTERLKNLGSRMENSAKYLTSTLNNLLHWSMQQMGKFPYSPETINLKIAIDENLNFFENSAKRKGVIFESHISSTIHIHMDKNALGTILRNVLNNSIKFSDQNDLINISTQMEKGMVMLSIQDEGVGMSSEQREKILKGDVAKGEEGTDGEKSTGLGWSLVKDLIEQNKARFDIISENGKGTIVKFYFPLN